MNEEALTRMDGTPGPTALVGGWEHTPGCEPIDDFVMQLLGTKRPRVTIVPVTSTKKMLPVAIERAHGYWNRLGGRVAVSLPQVDNPQPALELLTGSDIIVLTGGLADRLTTVLTQTGAWDRILELWRDGSALIASSRGLMEIFEWRWALRGPSPFKLRPGLGLYGGYIGAPHFDRYRMRRWSPRLAIQLASRDLSFLGVDERTDLVGGPTGFTVVGSGRVGVMNGPERREFGAGTQVTLNRDSGRRART